MKKARHLIKSIYTADPRAHVYDGKLYIYPSHDIESGIPEDDTGAHFDMKDYHVYSDEYYLLSALYLPASYVLHQRGIGQTV